MSQKFKLAVIQMKISESKVDSVHKAIENVAYMADKGANMVVLPEMFNCPYETYRFPAYAEAEGGDTYQRLSKIAKEKKVYLVAGSVPEVEADRIYNTTYIFGPSGDLIGKHRKMHLFEIDIVNGQYFREAETLTAGKSVTVVDTEFGKIGVAICFDVRFPELARLMAQQGAEMLIYPAAFNMTTGPAHWELLFRSRAIDQQVFTVGCAPARDYESNYISYGNSIIVNPWGEVIGRLNDEEGYLFGEIDLSEVSQIRAQLPLNQSIRDDVYELKTILKED
ncbi:carbon-nitrogen hydrolase family protein [Fusibacter ferrireducens]|uniref:Carbon-nitrogen hydrolase family protein n=1 Tax=Fusibacter ferrireducens TaxID=2785058 RepID=A0ABR9ZRB1_9FIRM|nr:carbon-nitrogen hydrolase family protein [Fusibacter ferrireducens]MBF4692983.1 carbon-nitrogen hydrolase family protein [Fusibacter ferrireducens]